MTSDEDTEEGTVRKRLIPALVALLCVGAVVAGVGWLFSSDSSARSRIGLTNDTGQTIDTVDDSNTLPTDTTIAGPTSTSGVAGLSADTAATTIAPAATKLGSSAVQSTPPAPQSTTLSPQSTTLSPQSTTLSPQSTTLSPQSTAPSLSSTAPTTSTTVAVSPPPAPSAPQPSAPASAAATSLSYPTNADGTPQPVLLVYDTDTITLVGMVPSQTAKDRLEALALANSQTPGTIVDELSINPDVPIGIGLRVIELNSTRFPSGSAKVQPAQGTEIARVATAMRALPNVTVVVIGHADQQGASAANLVISSQRARAVVDFLGTLGVDTTRLSARAAGDADLLTLDTDAAALALNRRTEFIFYGLLVS